MRTQIQPTDLTTPTSTAPRARANAVTVVVPTMGGPVLKGCLEALAAGNLWPARLIVAEQGQGVETPLVIAALRGLGMDVLHLSVEGTGISRATNYGMARVETPYVAVTHDDCRVRPDWLERLSARLAEGRREIYTGRVVPEGGGVVLTIKTDTRPFTFTSPPRRGCALFPSNMGFAMEFTTTVGWFDEHPSLATAGEDNDWAYRVLRAGVPIVYDPGVVVAHLARHRTTDLPMLFRRYARGHGAFYGKWIRRGDLELTRRAIVDLARAPWLLIRGVLSGNSELVAMGMGETAGLLPGILSGLRNRVPRP